MGSLTQERGDLPSTRSVVTSSAKATEGPRSCNKSIVSVKPVTGTTPIVAIFQHLIEQRLAD